MLAATFGPLPPRPKTWVDVFEITGGTRDVSIADIEQGRIDWEYDFTSSDMRHCGRTGCKQVHGHGWIVALRDGRYVQVGNDCARKYAKAELWDVQIALYSERIRMEAQAEALMRARDKAQAILFWLDNHSELRGAKALYSSFVGVACGPLLSDLRKRAEKGDSEVRQEVRLTTEEILRRREASTQVRSDGTTFTPQVSATEFVRTGVLRGIGCFRQHVTELVRSLERDAIFLLHNTHGVREKRELDQVREVINRIGITQRKVDRAVRDISIFFSSANLEVLLSTSVARSQGVVRVAVEGGEVIVTRRANWGRRAA